MRIFFHDRRFLQVTFFYFAFIKLPQFLPETKRFANIQDSLWFSALCDLPETFLKKFSENFFPQFFIP